MPAARFFQRDSHAYRLANPSPPPPPPPTPPAVAVTSASRVGIGQVEFVFDHAVMLNHPPVTKLQVQDANGNYVDPNGTHQTGASTIICDYSGGTDGELLSGAHWRITGANGITGLFNPAGGTFANDTGTVANTLSATTVTVLSATRTGIGQVRFVFDHEVVVDGKTIGLQVQDFLGVYNDPDTTQVDATTIDCDYSAGLSHDVAVNALWQMTEMTGLTNPDGGTFPDDSGSVSSAALAAVRPQVVSVVADDPPDTLINVTFDRAINFTGVGSLDGWVANSADASNCSQGDVARLEVEMSATVSPGDNWHWSHTTADMNPAPSSAASGTVS